MTRDVWLYLWITISLVTPVVNGRDLRGEDRDTRHPQVQSVASPLASDNDTAVVEEFQHRLRQYDAVPQRLDASLPVQSVSSNPTVIIAIVEAHQEAMRAERLTARQGDMFFPTITELFRRWILESLHGMTADEFLVMITEDDAPPMAPPSVNASYPDGGALTTMPPQLLQVFPRLPSGLEYRFIDRDLILWDSHANLIIDFIPEALSIADES
jgi:hypothetical protein